MNNIVYLQADLRFGNNILSVINGKLVLNYTIESILALDIQKIICGIYECEENQMLVDVLKQHDVEIIMSKEENVTKRMLEALQGMEEGYIIRIAGDQCLLDVKLTNYIINEFVKSESEFFYEESPTSSVIPDIVSIECLKRYEEKYSLDEDGKRYFHVLKEEAGIKRLHLMLPTLLFNFRANCNEGIKMCQKVIVDGLDMYASSQACANKMARKNSHMVETGLLSSWILPYYEDFFVDENKKHNPW